VKAKQLYLIPCVSSMIARRLQSIKIKQISALNVKAIANFARVNICAWYFLSRSICLAMQRELYQEAKGKL